MINRKDITNVAKRMLRHHRGLEDPQIIHPQRDWFIGIGVSALVFALIMFWNVTAYIKHSNTNVDASIEAVNTDSVYREGQVKSALEFFSEREKKFNELISQTTDVSEVVEIEPEPEEVIVVPETEEEIEEVAPVVGEVTPTLSE
jgi:hypothetical protein